jgi:inner membrane protein
MDNLTHTLVGAALGQAGLKRRTALAMPALLIGANLPDVDAFIYFWGSGVEALAFRRGWTHGVLAMSVLPLVLWLTLLATARLRRKPPGADEPPLLPRQLLLVCAVGVWSHPLLDWLNTYGVRLLMPFSGEWFYGDTLFIVDPWVWLALGVGMWISRRRETRGAPRPLRPMRAALVAALAYVAMMNAGSAAARRSVAAQAPEATRILAGPAPLDPFRREFVYRDGDVYRRGTTGLFAGGALTYTDTLPIHADHPAARQAAETRDGSLFLVWSRYPFFDVQGTRVWIGDARYTGDRTGWAEVGVDLD